MKVWHGLETYPHSLPNCAVAIGRFDGVHIGHRALIEAAVSEACDLRVPSVIFTFDRHPQELFAPEHAPEYLTTLEQKINLIEELNPDHLLIARFDERFRDLSPEAFLHFVIGGMLGACSVLVGEDFRFGFDQAGDVNTLRSGQQRFGYRTNVVPAVMVDGSKAASRTIRELLQSGDLVSAVRALGHPYRLTGVVGKGQQLGRRLGYPTANLTLCTRQVVPQDGIYAAWADIGGSRHAAACSIGFRPTVGGTTRTIEGYLLDFNGDLYDKTLELEMVARLRGEEKFDTIDALVQQIVEDVTNVRRLLLT